MVDSFFEPSHFKLLNFKNKVVNHKLDITDLKKLKKVFNKIQPDFVFHLAAQSLVKTSYENPETTFKSNCIGTLNILESLYSSHFCIYYLCYHLEF